VEQVGADAVNLGDFLETSAGKGELWRKLILTPIWPA
jgi:hypothetical protein